MCNTVVDHRDAFDGDSDGFQNAPDAEQAEQATVEWDHHDIATCRDDRYEIDGCGVCGSDEIDDDGVCLDCGFDPADLDGDHESALASAGFGLDESYE